MNSQPRAVVIEKLLGTLHETLPYHDQSAGVLERSYAPGKWSMREVLVHLSDCETVLLDRLRRLAAEEKPLLVAFDENRWAKTLFYKRRDLHLAKAQYETARRSVIELAGELDPALDANLGTHSHSGTRSFAQILQHIADHNAHHLGQLRAIAGGRAWAP